MKETFVQRFKKALEVRSMKQSDIVEKTGIGKSAISQYFSGKYEPKQKALYLLAQALDVDEAWLMGYDVPMEKVQISDAIVEGWDAKYNPDGRLAKETQVCELIEECHGADALDAVSLYIQLDANDRAEIRGEMKHMLKSDKYAVKKESKNA